jgi:hypothetical protein
MYQAGFFPVALADVKRSRGTGKPMITPLIIEKLADLVRVPQFHHYPTGLGVRSWFWSRPPFSVAAWLTSLVVSQRILRSGAFCLHGEQNNLDSAMLIYYLNGVAPFQVGAPNRLTALRGAGDQSAGRRSHTPECRVKPIQLGDTMQLSKVDGFFPCPTCE